MNAFADAAPILSARGLTKHYRTERLFGLSGGHVVRAVDDVSIDVRAGESYGLVGESGCGKSTLGRLLLRLIEPTSGTVTFEGRDLAAGDGAARRALGSSMQIIFQDPYSSLNPSFRVRDILWEGLRHVPEARRDSRTARRARMTDLLVQVGLSADYLDRFPHELSAASASALGSPAP